MAVSGADIRRAVARSVEATGIAAEDEDVLRRTRLEAVIERECRALDRRSCCGALDWDDDE